MRVGRAWPPPLLQVMAESKGTVFLTVSRQPARPLWSGSQLCKDLRSSQKDQYHILNITMAFIKTILQQKHFILSWDPIKIDFGPVIGRLPCCSVFATSEDMSMFTRPAGPAQEAWGQKSMVMQYVRDAGHPGRASDTGFCLRGLCPQPHPLFS